jgi:hypothetical protein
MNKSADRDLNSRNIREYNFNKNSEIVHPEAIELTTFAYDYTAVQSSSFYNYLQKLYIEIVYIINRISSKMTFIFKAQTRTQNTRTLITLN